MRSRGTQAASLRFTISNTFLPRHLCRPRGRTRVYEVYRNIASHPEGFPVRTYTQHTTPSRPVPTMTTNTLEPETLAG
jgi:hypothetical protein